MKRVLILSYHHPPLNVIASYRSRAFAEHLHHYGIYPIIVTHRWETDKGSYKFHSKSDGIEVERHPTHEVIRLPRRRLRLGGILTRLNTIPGVGHAMRVLLWVTGNFDMPEVSISSFRTYRSFLVSYLRENKVDALMGIFSPHHHIRLIAALSKRFNIPFTIDFRDTWNNQLLDKEAKETLRDRLVKLYWRKWMRNAAFYTSISEPWVSYISALTRAPGHTVMHGYEEDVRLAGLQQPDRDNFIILYPGTITASEEMFDSLGILAQGLEMILQENPGARLQVVFVGPAEHEWIRTIFRNHGIEEHVQIFERRPREEVLRWYQRCSLLLRPSYLRHKGYYSGKLFEYLGTGRNILVVPSDQGVIDRLIDYTKAGRVANTPGEVAALVAGWMKEWNQDGRVAFHGIPEVLGEFTRKYQTGIWANAFHKHIK